MYIYMYIYIHIHIHIYIYIYIHIYIYIYGHHGHDIMYVEQYISAIAFFCCFHHQITGFTERMHSMHFFRYLSEGTQNIYSKNIFKGKSSKAKLKKNTYLKL